ncbi:hypothetical protein DRP77_09480 [Candidatus Poribacteria bacterium]|mgnify:CR=1 FL=1|nr:MAG: hypothetical protein DRP77_09480 [Candidatus Poribacteria bacterium]RLF10054.1 MAG: hypothetical protein DRJ62_05685 [Thermoprotei archaeon]
MSEVVIFGKPFKIILRESREPSVEVRGDKVFVSGSREIIPSLFAEFLEEKLYERLFDIYDEIKSDGRVEILGELDFEVVERIDGRGNRIAKLKGNKILVKRSAIALPEEALRYIVAHEIAHLLVKRHTARFWDIVRLIYPDFEKGKRSLEDSAQAETLIKGLKGAFEP